MKKTFYLFLFICFTQNVSGQLASLHDRISGYFHEVQEATKSHQNLWNRDLYGPMLLVDPANRQTFGNEPDADGILKPVGNIYTGILPDNVNVANTSVQWGGKTWAMIMLPLPENKHDRMNLLTHELFHTAQPALGFILYNTENNHLDQKDGRIYLRLELEALQKALRSTSEKETQTHLNSAMAFRKFRYALYSGADTTETQLELNEGIAEYTGLIISGRNQKQTADYFVNGINAFYTNPTYVRSFAYYTTPVYGYFLYKKNQKWHKEISIYTDLTDYFFRALELDFPEDLRQTVESLSDKYNGKTIIQEETAREEKTKQLIAEYKFKFIEQSHLEIYFEQMNISFDPGNIMPIEDKGTMYPNIRVVDLWGVLTVENGALMSPNWDKISVTSPITTVDKKISGDGWTLDLNEGYFIKKDETNGNYRLVRRE